MRRAKPNAITILGDTATINMGAWDAVIDICDLELVQQHKWYPFHRRTTNVETHYAHTTFEQKTLFLHRLLLSPPPGMQVDHIDHDGLNNRRINIRVVTPKENSANRRRYPRAPYKHKAKYKRSSGKRRAGVYSPLSRGYRKHGKKWKVDIMFDRKRIYLGVFATEIEASAAYRAAVAKYSVRPNEGTP